MRLRIGWNPWVRTKRHLEGCDSRCVVVINPVHLSGCCIGTYKKVRTDTLKEAIFVSVVEADCQRRDSLECVSEPCVQGYIPQVPTREPLVECDTYLYVSIVGGTSGR